MLSLGLCKAQFSFATWFPVSVNRHRERLERWRENSSWPTPYTTVDSSFFHFSHTPKNNISAPLPGDITTLAAWYPVLRGPAPSLPVDSLLILQTVNIHSRGFLTKFWVPDICGPQSNYTYKWASFSRPEYWSRWPVPSPGDLPIPGIKPRSPTLRQILKRGQSHALKIPPKQMNNNNKKNKTFRSFLFLLAHVPLDGLLPYLDLTVAFHL